MKRILKITVVTIVVGIMGAIGLSLGYFGNRVYRGVSVAGIIIGGMEKPRAGEVITAKLSMIKGIQLTWGKTKWNIGQMELGWEYDAKQTLEAAMSVGRRGGIGQEIGELFITLRYGQNIKPVFTIDENKLAGVISGIAGQINVPASEPEVTIDQTTRLISVSAGKDGQIVDEQQLSLKIRQRITEASIEPMEIPMIYLRPTLTQSQMEIVRKRAEGLIGKSIKLTFGEIEKQEWNIDDQQLVSWLDPQKGGWKRDEIENWMAELANTFDKPAQNATFRFVGGGRVEEFKPATEGYRIKQAETTDTLVTALIRLEMSNQETTINLIVDTIEPEIKTSDVNTLGIKELLGRGESWFSGSINNRIYNLAKASETINGTLVSPGETFSFIKTVGEISAATGYKQAYIIKEGKTILGDGGGVCQSSTTLFRAVLAAGLPIEERTAHAYRVSYYEEKYEPGFDATVFEPAPDFKFKNDTQGYILIQSTFDEVNKHLEFDIYGTSDGRKTIISKARLWDVTSPPPDLYVDDPNTPVGKVIQTEHKAWGAKVAFDWKVTRADEVLQQRTFYSNFQPWQAVYLRGTKTN